MTTAACDSDTSPAANAAPAAGSPRRSAAPTPHSVLASRGVAFNSCRAHADVDDAPERTPKSRASISPSSRVSSA